MDSAADAVTHYDAISRAWQYLLGEDFHYGYFRAADETLDAATANLTLMMAEAAALGRDLAVLDVGCGIGTPACFIADRFGCRVTGITTSPVGVEHARGRARERGCDDRVEFRIADGMDNRLPGASFDRAWVLESSHLMPRKGALLAECARVLRPGGRLVLCDIIVRRELPQSELLSRARDFLHLHYAFGHAKLEMLATYRRLAQEVGLAVVETRDVSDAVFPTIDHWRRRIRANEAEVRALIGDEGVAHFRESCEVLTGLWQQGVFGYGLLVAAKPAGNA